MGVGIIESPPSSHGSARVSLSLDRRRTQVVTCVPSSRESRLHPSSQDRTAAVRSLSLCFDSRLRLSPSPLVAHFLFGHRCPPRVRIEPKVVVVVEVCSYGDGKQRILVVLESMMADPMVEKEI
ncbi:hypothetical protein RIF29_36644 [Crotalaria pallida]|uniref:Uncharacterized protein n=1 Tax=Crotalaria pallida TaxID=3830 RepID=A0AAN9EBB7_CROPI